MTVLRKLLLATAVAALAAPAWAGSVSLKANPIDDDGQVTLGDLFDGAGAAAGVVVAQRVGPSVVLDAGQLQAQARQAGLSWDNPAGLRRVAVRRTAPGAGAPPLSQATAGSSAAPRLGASGGQVIARNDMVRVTFQSGGVTLSVMGKAMRSAAVGEPVAVLNLASNKVIDAVASGPGLAVVGPAAVGVRAQSQQFASR